MQTSGTVVESVLCIKTIFSNYSIPIYMNAYNYQQYTGEGTSLIHHSGMSSDETETFHQRHFVN